MTLVAFDAEYAGAVGYDVRRIDLAMMGLVLAVTVIGLKLVGLILIVAMLIIPPVTARFWTDRIERVIWIAGVHRRHLGLCRRGALGFGARDADGADHRADRGALLRASRSCSRRPAASAAAVIRHRRFQTPRASPPGPAGAGAGRADP